MRIYITSRFKGASENKQDIERLCGAVRSAGLEDFHFIRDVEKYQPNFFNSQKELWEVAKRYVSECDAMLIDVSDSPTGGRLIEAGIAYALSKPIYVVVKRGVEHKSFYEGIANTIIQYDEPEDITKALKKLLGTR